jgi:methylated-DNA-[protein]-cysteine S-methyltransferase
MSAGASRAVLDTPLGPFWVEAEGGAVTRAGWGRAEAFGDDPGAAEAARQVAEYFAGTRTGFALTLAPAVPEAQRRFMDALAAIPFGETRTYGEMARLLGITAQEAGQACGRNCIGIIVPCHRVLGTHGLGGFSAPGGVETKVALLRHEGAAGLLI